MACVDDAENKDVKIECYEMNNLDSISITPVLLQITNATGRQFYGLESDFAINYVAQLGLKQNYQHMLEYQLLGKNPQYKLNYSVNPVDLMNYQAAFQTRGKRWLPLFSSGVVAPESMMIHELINVESSVDFPVYFKAKGGMFKEVNKTLGHRFIMRSYAQRKEVASIIKSKSIFIFEEEKSKDITYGDKIDPVNLVFEYQKKKYKISNDYLNHLTAENVTFKNPKLGASVKSIKTYEELITGMAPLTTKSIIETK